MRDVNLRAVLLGFQDELIKLSTEKKVLVNPEDLSGLGGAIVAGGAAQHYLPDVGQSGMTKFRKGALVSALIGAGGLGSRILHRAIAREIAKRKKN